MSNLYGDVGMFQRRFLDGQALDSDDRLLALQIIGAASRSVDGLARRKFYAESTTRLLRGNGARTLELAFDLASVTSLKFDEDDDRVYELTLVEGTDFELAGEDDENDDRPPYRLVRLLNAGQRQAFPVGRRTIQLIGREGYSNNVEAVLTSAGAAVTGTLADTTDTTLATSAAAYPEIAPGMTLRIESEDVYVLPGAIASPFVVKRGVNGTTAAAHTAAAISSYVYEDDVVGAVLVQTGRLWKRKDSPMLSTLLNAPMFGDMQLSAGLDPDVQMQIARLKRFL